MTFKVHCGLSAAGRRAAWTATFFFRILTFALLATAAPAPADQAIAPLTPPDVIHLHGEIFHVQGLDLDENYIYVSSVDVGHRRAMLHKFTRAGDLVAVRDLTEGARYHAGGLSLDGDSLWIPVAEYRAGSTTRMIEVEKNDFTVKSTFVVKDHIGAVAAAGGVLHGGNWDSEDLYAWDTSGNLLRRIRNPTRVAYQDLKVVEGGLVASGLLRGGQAGAVDWLDRETLAQRRRLAVGRMDGGGVWTQEGMALKDGRLYLLPEDGSDGGARLYVFDLTALKDSTFTGN